MTGGAGVRPDRAAFLREAGRETVWDVVVIGGGATGLGVAVEAASRGYSTLLLERDDFAKGTSSRSTKLVHGGVRYLQQMNVTLVLDALKERGRMLRNAPHLVHAQSFVVPVYGAREKGYYGLGLKVYEWMSGRLSLGRSRMLSAGETAERLSTVKRDGLKGGVLYFDGQFDDARYAVSLMRTAVDLGAVVLNHAEVVRIVERDGRVGGVEFRDCETGTRVEVKARAVVNAAGVFAEDVLRKDGEAKGGLLAVSQGSHFVLGKEWLPGTDALMVPKTADGRVLFAVPWHDALVVGTTDVGVPEAVAEPRAREDETAFLREHVRLYLERELRDGDVRSVWSGLRPLVKSGESAATKKISRDHKVLVAGNGMVTIVGGKWTTYRRMGEDTVNRVAEVAGLTKRASRTAEMPLHGAEGFELDAVPDESERVYGTDLAAVRAIGEEDAAMNERVHARLPYRMREVVWAARSEMARTTEDVLARRLRALFLDARAAMEAAPRVAAVLGRELGWTEAEVAEDVRAFEDVARGYVYGGGGQ